MIARAQAGIPGASEQALVAVRFIAEDLRAASVATESIREVLELVRHFGGCPDCCDEHGEYPESVLCYCQCHEGVEARWLALRDQVLAVLRAAAVTR